MQSGHKSLRGSHQFRRSSQFGWSKGPGVLATRVVPFLLLCCRLGSAQAIPAATKPLTAQVGVGFAVARSGYTYSYIKGFTAYGDLDLRQRVGVEGVIHFTNIFTPDDIGERSFLLGPRLTLLRGDFNGRPNFVNAYVKVLGGEGYFEFQQKTYQPPVTNRYRMWAYGGGIDLHVSRHLNVRPIELEWQRWPGFSERGLKPVVATFGAAYAF